MRRLPSTGTAVSIPARWEDIPALPSSSSEPRFLQILDEHGLSDVPIRVPLVGRYTRGRPWSAEEFEAVFEAWSNGISLTRVAAALNRNPQDIIFRLLDECSRKGLTFTERGRSEGSERWTPEVARCAAALFQAGLPAWRIAVLFQVDFEHVEKALFAARPGYGHKKLNPFAINTEHKLHVNSGILAEHGPAIQNALDAFAGQGATTALIERHAPDAEIIAVELDHETYASALRKLWRPGTTWVNEDNTATLERLKAAGSKFDLIDLDPFVSCSQQLPLAMELLKDRALLFVTLGGEYRRSFIGSNRKAIAARYGFVAPDLENAAYLEQMPFYFVGYVATQAARNGFVLSTLRAVRYANNCRFWFHAERRCREEVDSWLREACTVDAYGTRMAVALRRFAEVRRELSGDDQLGFL